MFDSFKEILRNGHSSGTSLLRDLAIALLGAIARLVFDHDKYSDGATIQFWYDLFRAFSMASIVVLIMEAAVDTMHVSGAVAVALLAGGSFFAVEILYIFKKSIGTFITAVVKKILS